MGRLDFKSSLRGGDPVVGGFDSHTLPPKFKDIKGVTRGRSFCNITMLQKERPRVTRKLALIAKSILKM